MRRANNTPLRKNKQMDFIARLLATMAGLWISTLLVPSIRIASSSASETVIVLAVVALVFTVVNSVIKPVVKTLAFPLYLVTFGLFAMVTNSALFALTGWLSTWLGVPLSTGGFWSCLAGAVITSVVASIVSGVLRDKKDKRG
ncbi:putative membrane protein [Schaalia meyeri]|nr:putative membrane protein [Schaalia meyeri]